MPTNMSRQIYHTNRLCFGVPLEDAFPDGEVHPRVKKLLLEAYNTVVDSQYSVEEVLCFQGTLNERLTLKEHLVHSKDLGALHKSPGSLLWVIRHFIGLLPIPPLPIYCEGKKFSWAEVSKLCRTCLVEYPTRGRFDPQLLKTIAERLRHLPRVHLFLIASLMEFLRALCVLPRGEPRVNKNSLLVLTKYFTPCLFLRPYCPGWGTKQEKNHYPLVIYLILKWPELRSCLSRRFNISHGLAYKYPLKDNTTQTEEKRAENIEGKHHTEKAKFQNRSESDDERNLYKLWPSHKERRSHIQGLKEEANLFKLEEDACNFSQKKRRSSSVHKEEMLSHNVPTEENASLYMPNLEEQTPYNPQEERRRNPKREEPIQIQKQVIFITRRCCCTYSSNYESEKYEPCNYESEKDEPYNYESERDEPCNYQSEKDEPNHSKPKRPKKSIHESRRADVDAKRLKKDANIEPEHTYERLRNSKDYGFNLDQPSTCSTRRDYGWDIEDIEVASRSSGEYIDDGYSKLNLIDRTPSYETLRDFDPVQKASLAEKVCRMGWSYNPSNEASFNTSNIQSNQSFKLPEADPNMYKLSFGRNLDSRNALNEALKEKLKDMKLAERLESECEESGAGTGRKTILKLDQATSKSAMKVGKIRSKLEFWKRMGRSRARKSSSCVEVDSGFKYMKMVGSASSLL